MLIKVVQVLMYGTQLAPILDTASKFAQWGIRGDNYASSPLVSLSPEYFALMQLINQKGLKHEIMDITEDYSLYATRAPDAYDYTGFGTMQIGWSVDQKERLVLIPHEREDYQLGRYGSGLYATRKLA